MRVGDPIPPMFDGAGRECRGESTISRLSNISVKPQKIDWHQPEALVQKVARDEDRMIAPLGKLLREYPSGWTKSEDNRNLVKRQRYTVNQARFPCFVLF